MSSTRELPRECRVHCYIYGSAAGLPWQRWSGSPACSPRAESRSERGSLGARSRTSGSPSAGPSRSVSPPGQTASWSPWCPPSSETSCKEQRGGGDVLATHTRTHTHTHNIYIGQSGETKCGEREQKFFCMIFLIFL